MRFVLPCPNDPVSTFSRVRKSTLASGLLVGIIAGSWLPFSGCGSSDTADDVCEGCPSPDIVVKCYNAFDDYQGSMCTPGNLTDPELAYECKVEFGILTSAYGVRWACDGSSWGSGDAAGEEGDDEGVGETANPLCASWDPDAEVSLVASGKYDVDAAFVAALVSNPLPLLECDGARFEPTAEGYEVVGATSGTFVYALGLRKGDIILKINDLSLDSSDDAATALGELYFAARETNYSLEFSRNSTVLTYNYELI